MWVPPSVSRELVEDRIEYSTKLRDLLYLEGGILDDWNRELRKIDPYLRLGQAVEKVPVGFPLKPGYFHIIRLNPDAPPTTNTLEGPNGEFVQPSLGMLERLKASDLQNAAVMRARKAAEQAQEAAKEKEKQGDRELRVEEGVERYKAATRTQVLTSEDVPWSQNVAGRRNGKG